MDEAEKPRPRRAIPGGEDKWRSVGDDFSTIFRPAHQPSPERAVIEDDDDTAVRPAIRDREGPDPRAAFAAADAAAAKAARSATSEDGQAPDSEPDHDSRGWLPMIGSIGWTALSTILPGAGMLAARSRAAKVTGGVVLAAFLVGAIWFIGQVRGGVTSLSKFAQPSDLGKVIAALIIVGLVWVAVIAGTQLLTRPRGLAVTKRMAGAVAVTLFSLAVATPLALAARYTFDTQKLVTTVFAQEKDVQSTSRPTIDATQKNPWEGHPRLNILLVGADSNAARIERDPKYYTLDAVRTDTMMVASINTTTGTTTIIQLPRNLLRAPFPAGSPMAELYPDGFRTGDDNTEMLTELWSKARNPDYPEIGKIFEGNTYPGAELLKQAVEGITDLHMDYFVLLNVDGLRQLIDAMGGVTVNINERLPKGRAESCGDWNIDQCLQPGPKQHLGGYDAMWYARSRKNTSDYSRMARQSCLVNAIIDQANPATMLTSYEAIASASADMVVTDIPQEVIEPIVALSVKVKDAKVSRLVFAPGRNGYEYKYPNFEKMREAVAKAIAADNGATQKPTPPTSSSAPTSPSATTSPPKQPKPTVTPSTPEIVDGSQGVADACAYNPVKEN